MIATKSLRPILKIGKYYIMSYDEQWLSDAFDKAAKAMGGDVTPFKQDLLAGVMSYLEKVCPLQVLPIEELFEKIRTMLRNVGLSHLACGLITASPPIALNLGEMAARCPMPLFFFHTLKEELTELRHSGVESCAFSGIRECVMTLENSHRWTRHCQLTEADLMYLISRTMSAAPHLAA